MKKNCLPRKVSFLWKDSLPCKDSLAWSDSLPWKNSFGFFMWLFLPFVSLVVMSACSKDVSDEALINQETVVDDGAKGRLTVKTRADGDSGDDEGNVSYPVNVYVFDNAQHCVSLQTLNSSSDALAFSLPAGTYNIYAVGEASSERYELPTQSTAAASSVIRTREGMELDDLMTARAVVTLAQSDDNSLLLSMTRKVALLRNVIIRQVPEDVTGVSLSIGPTYTGVTLDGSFSGADGLQTVTLTRDAATGNWTESGVFIFPTTGNESSITVRFTTSGGVKSYTSNVSEGFPANYRIDLDGTYTGGFVTLSGTIRGVSWAETKTITFTFNESGGAGSSSDGGSNSGNEDTGNAGNDSSSPVAGTVPAKGTFYQGCYVLKVDGKTATVLSSKQKTNIGATMDDVSGALSTWSVDGINASWRLPTEAEAKEIFKNRSAISYIKLGTTSYDRYYYYTDGTNLLMFNNTNDAFKGQTIVRADDRLYLCPVADITFE